MCEDPCTVLFFQSNLFSDTIDLFITLFGKNKIRLNALKLCCSDGFNRIAQNASWSYPIGVMMESIFEKTLVASNSPPNPASKTTYSHV